MKIMPKINKAVILAGGRGSRLGKITNFSKEMPFGNIHKTTLPIVNRPNIVRTIEQLNRQCGITNFYVSADYMAGDVLSTLEHGKVSSINIHFIKRDVKENTGTALLNMIKRWYPNDFKDDEYFMVVPGDKSFPQADFGKITNEFLEFAERNPNILAGTGFVIRTADEMIREYPSAVLSENGMIESIADKPTTFDEAAEISVKSKHPSVRAFSEQTGKIGLPLSTGIWVFNKKVFDVVPRPQEADANDFYTLGRYILPKLAGRMWGTVFSEPIENSELFRHYYDIGCPEYFYRANWSFIKTMQRNEHQIPGVFTQALRSWMSQTVDLKGKVLDSVIGENVHISKNSKVQRSIIGHGSILDGVEIRNSIILPYTYINYPKRSKKRISMISNSIVGGKIRGGTFIDYLHLSPFMSVIDKAVVAPNMNGYTNLDTELIIGPDDIELVKNAFKE